MCTCRYTTFDDIKREGSVGQRSSFTYVASLINCLLWFFYGCSPKGTVLIACLNLLGVGFQIFYLCVFWMYTEEDEDFHWGLVPLVSGLIAAVVIAMYFGSDIHGKIVFLSWCCAICKGLLAAAPLLTIVSDSSQLLYNKCQIIASISRTEANLLWMPAVRGT
jgi:solute carrier family 50 protein (sugar transporter)